MRNAVVFDPRADDELAYDPVTVTLAAGATLEVPASCSWVGVLGATTDLVSISINGKSFFTLSIGLAIKPRNPIRRLFIKNTSGSANTITISKGLGEFDDNRVVIAAGTLLPVDPKPTAYGARYTISTAAGSVLASVTVVAAGSNLLGILVLGGSLVCGPDPTALMTVSDSTSAILAVTDSAALPVGSPFTIPAGNALAVATTGLCRGCLFYRIL